MRKWNIILLIMALMTTLVSGLDLCEDSPNPNQDCNMITPSLTGCSTFNYTVLNKSGDFLEQGLLTVWNSAENLYNFTFNQEAGSYIVSLCDGTTREVLVGDDDMTWTALIIVIISFIIFHFTMFKTITRSELKLLKFFSLFMFIMTGLSLGIIPLVLSNNSGDVGSMQFFGLVYLIITLTGYFLFSWSWLFKVIKQAFTDVDDKSKAIKGVQDEGKII